jgi:hypothetical protein
MRDWKTARAKCGTVAAEDYHPATHQIYVWMRFQELELEPQTFRICDVVGIYAREIFSISHCGSPVELLWSAAMRSVGDDPNPRIIETLHNFQGMVTRSVVHYQQLPVLKGLVQD